MPIVNHTKNNRVLSKREKEERELRTIARRLIEVLDTRRLSDKNVEVLQRRGRSLYNEILKQSKRKDNFITGRGG